MKKNTPAQSKKTLPKNNNKLKKIDWSNPSMIDIYRECSIQYYENIHIQVWTGEDWKGLDSEHKNGGWFFQDMLFREYFGPYKNKEDCVKHFSEYYKEMGFLK